MQGLADWLTDKLKDIAAMWCGTNMVEREGKDGEELGEDTASWPRDKDMRAQKSQYVCS